MSQGAGKSSASSPRTNDKPPEAFPQLDATLSRLGVKKRLHLGVADRKEASPDAGVSKDELVKPQQDGRRRLSGIFERIMTLYDASSPSGRERIVLAASDAFESIDALSPSELGLVFSHVSAEFTSAERLRWRDRPTGRKTNPSLFVDLHYGRTISRAELLGFDRDLYFAYAHWIKRHPEDDLGLATKSDVLDRKASVQAHVTASDYANMSDDQKRSWQQTNSNMRTRKARAAEKAQSTLAAVGSGPSNEVTLKSNDAPEPVAAQPRLSQLRR